MKITLNREEIESALLEVVREKMLSTSEREEEEAYYFNITDSEGNDLDFSNINFVIPYLDKL